MKIGVFDSGIGGLSILRECIKRVHGIYFYYGDNENAPYGIKSEREILTLARKAFDVFMGYEVDVVVIACNTVTAVCIDALRKEYPFPIIGTEPALSLAWGKCLLLATKATLASSRVDSLIKKVDCSVIKYTPMGLVEEIERNIFSLERVDLSFLEDRKEDCIVLGCTHYSWVKDRINLLCPAIDGTKGVVERLCFYEKNHKTGKKVFLDEGTEREMEEKQGNVGKNRVCEEMTGIFNHRRNECLNFLKKDEKTVIFYLGSGKNRNFIISKQMFVL